MELKLENLNRLLFDKLDELIDDGKLTGKKILLFGLNSTSFCIKKYLEQQGFVIDGYLDNDLNKIDDLMRIKNMMIRNILPVNIYNSIHSKIISAMKPDEVIKMNRDNTIILIASKYYKEMKQQLENYGYCEEVNIYQIIDFYMIDQILKQDSDKAEHREYSIMLLESVKNTQLEIIKELKEICEKNNLRYYICGGTLLGAVRHKGYIPWDDDIDIAMPLPDYKKLIELLKEDKKYGLLSAYNEPEIAYFFFMKMYDKDTILKSWEYPFLVESGVGIDIFPLFGLPKDDDEIKQYYNKIRYLNTEFINTFLEDYSDKEILNYRNELRDRILEMIEEFSFDESEKIGYLLSKYKEKEIMARKIYESQVYLEFEGIMLSAASGYHEYLTILFRDYMKIPPLEQRYNTHNFIAYKNT